MVNHYARGARVENEFRDRLGELGYDVIRSAGSKGKIDLVAFNEFELLFIQVKIHDGLTKPAERQELIRQAKRVGAVPLVAFKTKENNRLKYRYKELKGQGPKDWEPWVPMAEILHKGCEKA